MYIGLCCVYMLQLARRSIESMVGEGQIQYYSLFCIPDTLSIYIHSLFMLYGVQLSLSQRLYVYIKQGGFWLQPPFSSPSFVPSINIPYPSQIDTLLYLFFSLYFSPLHPPKFQYNIYSSFPFLDQVYLLPPISFPSLFQTPNDVTMNQGLLYI